MQVWRWAFTGLFIKIIVACKGSRQPLVTLQGGAGLFIMSELNKEGTMWLESWDNACVLPSPADFLLTIVCRANSLDAHCRSTFLQGTQGETDWFVTPPKDVLSSTLTSFSMGAFCPHPQTSGLVASTDCHIQH